MERVLALIDGEGVVKNVIIADDTWDYGGIDTRGAIVGIGDIYDFVNKVFYSPENKFTASYDSTIQNALEQ